jgi:hypothetical protein
LFWLDLFLRPLIDGNAFLKKVKKRRLSTFTFTKLGKKGTRKKQKAVSSLHLSSAILHHPLPSI